ncbi:putative D-tyrosyl-tRNA(Tyr) deacylase [Cooperia oncophora]
MCDCSNPKTNGGISLSRMKDWKFFATEVKLLHKSLDMSAVSKCVMSDSLLFHGNKLDFHNSMNPQDASAFYSRFMDTLRTSYPAGNVQDGRFAAMMNVEIVNDGPVTISIDSKNRD